MAYRVRPRGWVVLVTGVLTVVAGAGAYLALRDVASRLEPAPQRSASEEVTFDAGLASAFTPGPRLGDLQDVFDRTSAPEASSVDVAAGGTGSGRESASGTSGDSLVATGDGDGRASRTFSGSGNFDSSQGHTSGQGSSDGVQRDPPRYPGGPSGGSRPGSRPSNGNELCEMPAFC